jgi:phosphoserine phosphatase
MLRFTHASLFSWDTASPWIGVLGGLLFAWWLLIALREIFSGLCVPALYLDYISEPRKTLIEEERSTLYGSIQTILSSFSFWALCFTWLLALGRMSREGRGLASITDFWIAFAAALFLTNCVRVYTFIASTNQARMLLLNFLIAFCVTAMVTLPLLFIPSEESVNNHWIPLVQFSSTNTNRPAFYFVFTLGIICVVAAETLLWAALPFVDVRRSYYEFLAEGGGHAETIADNRTEFMQAAAALAAKVRTKGSGVIKIATQTAGQEWGDLLLCLHSMFPERTKGNVGRFRLELLCPPHPSNLCRIADWLARDGVSVYCAEHMASSGLKFMIGNAPGCLSVLIGRPSQELLGRRYFPKSRWGYVFDDPTVAAYHESLFDAMKETGNTGQSLPEILLGAFLRERAGILASFEHPDIVGDGSMCAIWIEPKGESVVRLNMSNGSPRIEASGEGWEKLFPTDHGLEIGLAKEERGDFFLALDFDGVCSEVVHLLKLAASVGKEEAASTIANAHLYREEEPSLEMTLRQLSRMYAGLPHKSFKKIAEDTGLREEVSELISAAHNKQCRIAVITNGSREFVQLCLSANHLTVDGIWGTEVVFQEGICVGEVRGELIRSVSKGVVLSGLSRIWKAKPICIGDGWNDIHMFGSAIDLKGRTYLLREEDQIARDILERFPEVTRIENLYQVIEEM